MKLTLKENMILNKVIGDYVVDNNLFFDECKSLNNIVNKLKDIRLDYELVGELKNDLNYIKESRKEALKELSLYNIKSMCNKKWFGEYRNV